jgi:hypothetical protein
LKGCNWHQYFLGSVNYFDVTELFLFGVAEQRHVCNDVDGTRSPEMTL